MTLKGSNFAHLLIPIMTLFDPKARQLHHSRAQPDFNSHRFLFDHVSQELTERLKDIDRSFPTALNLSPHPLPYMCEEQSYLSETLSFSDNSYDLVFSCLQAHWVNNLPAFLQEIHRVLKPKGLFLGALCGGDTLKELRESLLQTELSLKGGASPRIAPMIHPSDAPHLLSKANFSLPVVDTDILRVTYPSLNDLMRDLRGMGETNKLADRPKTFTAKSLFEETGKYYFKK